MKNNIKPLTRDEIVDQVVNLGPLDIGGAMQQGLKVEIQEYFLQNKPSVQNFAEWCYVKKKYKLKATNFLSLTGNFTYSVF